MDNLTRTADNRDGVWCELGNSLIFEFRPLFEFVFKFIYPTEALQLLHGTPSLSSLLTAVKASLGPQPTELTEVH
jgi:hypothetical protein